MTLILDPTNPVIPDEPDWLKAEKLFRTRYHYAASSAHGMERLAFRVLPYSLIRSFALTFDPTEPFRLGSQKIAPVNRTRTRKIKGLHFSRRLLSRNSEYAYALAPNASGCFYVPAVETNTATSSNTSLFNDAPDLTWQASDSTRRTRKIGETMGAFVSFTYNPISTDRSVQRVSSTQSYTIVNPPCYLPAIARGRRTETRSTVGGAAIFPASQVTALRANSISATELIMTNNLSSMLANILPMSRRFNLAREVFELRDLPRSILSLKSTLQDLNQALKTMPRSMSDAFYKARLPEHVPNEYLSYWFGWVLTFKAIQDLLAKPTKIAKEVNFLISRRGRPTTLRHTRKVPGGVMTTPGWTYNPTNFSGTLWSEKTISTETVCNFETELRLVVNLLFDFPGVGVPKLRSDLLDRKWGVYPTLTDVYNVIPWTWLVDWFTGIGNYVELIDNVNTDPSLINWGLLTGVSSGAVRTTHRTYFDNSTSWSHNVNGLISSGTMLNRVTPTHQSVCEFKTIVRKDLVQSFGVRSTLKPSSMTPYQSSIVGAILNQRSGLARL